LIFLVVLMSLALLSGLSDPANVELR
jgi:hypothetical protein